MSFAKIHYLFMLRIKKRFEIIQRSLGNTMKIGLLIRILYLRVFLVLGSEL